MRLPNWRSLNEGLFGECIVWEIKEIKIALNFLMGYLRVTSTPTWLRHRNKRNDIFMGVI